MWNVATNAWREHFRRALQGYREALVQREPLALKPGSLSVSRIGICSRR